MLSWRFLFMAIAIASSSVLLSTPSNSFAQYSCPSWDYNAQEARFAIARLENEYNNVLAQEQQDPNYQPFRNSQNIRDEINSIKENCIGEIKTHIKVYYFYRNGLLNYNAPAAGEAACPGQWPMTKQVAQANLEVVNIWQGWMPSAATQEQLDTFTVQELESENQALAITFDNCVAFHESNEREEKARPTSSNTSSGDADDTFDQFPFSSECIIATAAFGSELAPQVQFLRGFRDGHILSTASGSSFMNSFNLVYYSFSPQVADYERGQPWMQQAVRIGIYPLLGILQVSEKAYSSMPGEFGALAAGLVASAMIGATYFSPVALSIMRARKSRLSYKLAACIIAGASAALVASILINSQPALMLTTSLFVLSIISISALLSARVISKIAKKISDAWNDNNRSFI